MTLDEAYKEKGLATTQIELWQIRLKQANDVILKLMREESKPQIVGVAENGSPS